VTVATWSTVRTEFGLAAVGTTAKFIQAAKELFNFELDEYDDMKAAKTLGKLLRGKKIIEIPEIVSGAADKIKRIVK
jgi:glycine cleavage system H lipoate-binding protein